MLAEAAITRHRLRIAHPTDWRTARLDSTAARVTWKTPLETVSPDIRIPVTLIPFNLEAERRGPDTSNEAAIERCHIGMPCVDPASGCIG